MNPVVRVLVVDNDYRFLELASAVFTKQGVEVVCASDPEQAHHHLNNYNNFDAVIADLSSPYFGSAQYCQNLVSRYPLVVVSASDDSNFLERYSSLCDCVLSKKSITESLYRATAKAIERHQLGLQQLVG